LKERVATPMAPRSRKRKSQYVKEHTNVTKTSNTKASVPESFFSESSI